MTTRIELAPGVTLEIENADTVHGVSRAFVPPGWYRLELVCNISALGGRLLHWARSETAITFEVTPDDDRAE